VVGDPYPIVNNMFVEIVGVPAKYKHDPFSCPSYYAMVGKLSKKYSIEYIHFVLSDILEWKIKSGKKMSVGYIVKVLASSIEKFEPYKDTYKIITREILENNGVKDFPIFMLSAAERKERGIENIGVTQKEIDDLKQYIKKGL